MGGLSSVEEQSIGPASGACRRREGMESEEERWRMPRANQGRGDEPSEGWSRLWQAWSTASRNVKHPSLHYVNLW